MTETCWISTTIIPSCLMKDFGNSNLTGTHNWWVLGASRTWPKVWYLQTNTFVCVFTGFKAGRLVSFCLKFHFAFFSSLCMATSLRKSRLQQPKNLDFVPESFLQFFHSISLSRILLLVPSPRSLEAQCFKAKIYHGQSVNTLCFLSLRQPQRTQ